MPLQEGVPVWYWAAAAGPSDSKCLQAPKKVWGLIFQSLSLSPSNNSLAACVPASQALSNLP